MQKPRHLASCGTEMTDYFRFYYPIVSCFLWFSGQQRRADQPLTIRIYLLGRVATQVKRHDPFAIGVIIVLPDDLCCVLALAIG